MLMVVSIRLPDEHEVGTKETEQAQKLVETDVD